jgi:Flp pilus assembly protein TadG
MRTTISLVLRPLSFLTRRPLVRSRFVNGENGQVLPFVLVALLGLLAIAGLAIDGARIFAAHRRLQAAADASATAGATALPDPVQAVNLANAYSASPSAKNALDGMNSVATTPVARCSSTGTAAGVPCDPVSNVNAITVTEQASVPLLFGGVLGFNSVSVTAKTTVLMRGGIPHPLDVMIVVDTTSSMGSSCSAGGSRLDCAKNGIRALLGQLFPCSPGATCTTANSTVDQVGLVVFPPLKSLSGLPNSCPSGSSASSYDNGDLSKPTQAQLATNPSYNYVVYPLQPDPFRVNDNQGTGLNPNSNLVKTINCINVTGGHGSSFKDAISAAQAALKARKATRPGVQDVLIFLSDGQANYAPVYYAYTNGSPQNPETSTDRKFPCTATVSAAHAASADATTQTWVYSIAYGADNSACDGWRTTSDNQTTSRFNSAESDGAQALSTMQNVACSPTRCPDPTKFFNQPSAASLTLQFTQVGTDLTTSRMIPDDAP